MRAQGSVPPVDRTNDQPHHQADCAPHHHQSHDRWPAERGRRCDDDDDEEYDSQKAKHRVPPMNLSHGGTPSLPPLSQ